MTPRFSIMKNAYLWVGIGAILMILAWFMFFNNARYSEEFTGWVKISVAGVLDQEAVTQDILEYMEDKAYKNNVVGIQTEENITRVSIRTEVEKDEQVNILSQDVQDILLVKWYITSTDDILEQSITGPSVWSYMQKAARNALIVGLILMAIYMLFSFAGIRKEIAPGLLAGVVIVSTIFDVIIPAGAYGLWMAINPTINIDTVFIIAILTTMGYSINDTIIIFDRIRENIKNKAGQKGVLFGKIFEESVRQTMKRSIMTSTSTFIVVLVMFIVGTGIIKQFAFTIGIGVIAGSFSSIFIAAPLAYILLGKYKKERKEMLAQK
jgi:preprotein translocase subunit SecF